MVSCACAMIAPGLAVSPISRINVAMACISRQAAHRVGQRLLQSIARVLTDRVETGVRDFFDFYVSMSDVSKICAVRPRGALSGTYGG